MDKTKLVEHLKSSLKDQAGEQAHKQLLMLNYLPLKNWDDSKEVIVASCLVEIEVHSEGVALPVRNWILMVPSGGALITQFQGLPVQILTDQSPLGAALLGKKKGDAVEFELAGKKRRYRVIGFR